MAKKTAPKKRIIKGRDYNEDKRSDGLRQAKSGGWRMAGTNRKPTKKEIQAHYDGESNGVYMENRIARMDKNPRAKKGERFEKGGFVGKGELVWKKLDNSKKAEFLKENFTPEITPRTQETLVGKAYNFLPSKVKIVLNSKYANVEEYSKGGEVSASDIKDLSNGYKEAILFTGYDEEEVELDRNYGIEDFDDKANAVIEKMAKQYILDNKEAIEESGLDYEQIGRDIWYTQAGHGVGFFDRKLDKDVEEKLTKGAKKFGDLSHNVFAQDGNVYLEGMKFAKGGKVDRSKSAKKPRVKRTKKAIAQDKNIKALHAGKRVSESGQVYWEGRENRSDTNRTKKLAKGGTLELRDIEDETVLMPYVIAEPIAETAAEITLKDEFSKWESLSKSEKEALDEKYKTLVDEISVYLVKRANTVYTHNKSFEKDVKGKKGREVLNTFMEHWCGLVDGKLVKPISDTMARYEKESKSTTFEHGGDIYPIENERKQSIKSGMILMVKDTKDEADKFVSDKPELVVEEFDGKWAIKKYAKGGEIVSFKKLKFNSHKNHNPNADILEGHIDNDSFITYGIYVEGDRKGNEFMEYYKGSNFVVGSKKPSSSRHYTKDSIPAKWKSSWDELKKEYDEKYSKEEYAKGGKLGFEGLAKKVAKEYEGDKVKPEYQDEYGKRYDKEEAKEVGQKVAAKVYREQQGMMEKGGEIKSELTLSEIESKLCKTFGFWDVPYEVKVDGITYRKVYMGKTYRKI